jgi:hypothetical protein
MTRALIRSCTLKMSAASKSYAIPELSPDRRPVLVADNYTGFGLGGISIIGAMSLASPSRFEIFAFG